MGYVETVKVAFEAMALMSKVIEHLESLLESQSKNWGVITSLIYVTIFEPRVTENDIAVFIEKVINGVGKIDKDALEASATERQDFGTPIIVGKSHFKLYYYATRLSDMLFYESLYRRLLDALEGDETEDHEEEPDEELVEEIGLEKDKESSEVLEKVTDITIVIQPMGNVRAEDVHTLIRTIVDETNFLHASGTTVKIRVIGYENEKKLNEIEKKLRERNVMVYRNTEKPILTIVLSRNSQILDKDIYSIIYSESPLTKIKILKH
jgi:hypothetical protein